MHIAAAVQRISLERKRTGDLHDGFLIHIPDFQQGKCPVPQAKLARHIGGGSRQEPSEHLMPVQFRDLAQSQGNRTHGNV
jgi:hypothetical protein